MDIKKLPSGDLTSCLECGGKSSAGDLWEIKIGKSVIVRLCFVCWRHLAGEFNVTTWLNGT